MEYAKELSALEPSARTALARALLRELERGGTPSSPRKETARVGGGSAPLAEPAPLAPTARRGADDPAADAASRLRAGEALPEETERQSLPAYLAAVNRRRAAAYGGAADSAAGSVLARRGSAMETAALPDAEALSAAVRRAARCEDGGYERY